jgi:hypothetical protein
MSVFSLQDDIPFFFSQQTTIELYLGALGDLGGEESFGLSYGFISR